MLHIPHRKRLVTLLALLGAASSAWTQTAPNAPATVGSGSGSRSQSVASSVPTIKATAQLVVVDVVVTDKHHKPVHGLSAANFSVNEGNVPQTIKHFEEHTARTLADAAKFAPMPKLPPNVFTNFTPAPASGAVNILLLDWLNTPLQDQAYARQQFLSYLKSVPPGTRMAIFGLGLHLYLLQDFTSDPDVLKAAFERERGKVSPLLADQVGGAGNQNNQTDNYQDEGTVPAFVIANLRQFDAVGETFGVTTRIRYTLDGMNQIARYLSPIPGRKNLIWFSGSFPLEILPDESGDQANPFAAMADLTDEYFDTVSRLARSQVSVYPVDVRGVMYSPTNNASASRPRDISSMKFLRQQELEHGTMDSIADETGGRAFYNTNDLTQAVTSAVQEGSNFYTLTYTPADSKHDGKLHKIKISLSPAGYELSYRRGYYADAPDKGDKAVVKAAAADSVPAPDDRQQSLRLAMMRGAPSPSDILIKVTVARLTAGGKTEDAVAPSNKPAPTTKGPYKRYSVDYAISSRDLTRVRGDDGKVHIDYDVLVYVYNANGELQNWLGGSHHLAASAEQMQQGTEHGILVHEEISVPAKGEYFLRIGVRDQHRDRYGVVEVAASQVRDVPEAGLSGQSAPPAK